MILHFKPPGSGPHTGSGDSEGRRAGCQKHLKKGAVVVTEVPSCKIRAIVSLPVFNPNDVASVLEDEDAPLLNRALSAYSVGSVFKLVSAASALEYGIPPEPVMLVQAVYRFPTTFSIVIMGEPWRGGYEPGHCPILQYVFCTCDATGTPGTIPIDGTKFGLWKQRRNCTGVSSAAGDLPTLESLKIPKALANFSFWARALTATPVQIAGMVNAIASGGEYTAPTIYEGFVNENLQYLDQAQTPATRRVMTEHTALCCEHLWYSRSKKAPASGSNPLPAALGQRPRRTDRKK